ncbi:predicted protein [Plenodomus lingam JN3]|uniref:Predicted protein n=1 Tax=Leptosphaeria maculans (strain JN3 / isolate v23.1.3 / race Av1-4-5-6-7-8) TaxID=985895 RepID=E5AEZ6_LEPMJ|nr:predicted protein [Plenodomus lingam JN3]CBY01785.1 predicted protein [Plenodomus lingam JN3]
MVLLPCRFSRHPGRARALPEAWDFKRWKHPLESADQMLVHIGGLDPLSSIMTGQAHEEYKCRHLRFIVRAWCTTYQATHKRCPLNIVAIEYRLTEECSGWIRHFAVFGRILTCRRRLQEVMTKIVRPIFSNCFWSFLYTTLTAQRQSEQLRNTHLNLFHCLFQLNASPYQLDVYTAWQHSRHGAVKVYLEAETTSATTYVPVAPTPSGSSSQIAHTTVHRALRGQN